MKAITVRQPWASAIATGAKRIENRTSPWTYRGPLAVHAGVGWSTRGARDARVVALFGRLASHERDEDGFVLHPVLPLGAFVALAELVDVHADGGCCRPWGESAYTEASGRRRGDIHHLVLEDVHSLGCRINARGRQGLWTPTADQVAEIRAAAGCYRGASA